MTLSTAQPVTSILEFHVNPAMTWPYLAQSILEMDGLDSDTAKQIGHRAAKRAAIPLERPTPQDVSRLIQAINTELMRDIHAIITAKKS
jgi:antitoxin component of RelBE/YafQ-DinJ toxin-antitoxin module